MLNLHILLSFSLHNITVCVSGDVRVIISGVKRMRRGAIVNEEQTRRRCSDKEFVSHSPGLPFLTSHLTALPETKQEITTDTWTEENRPVEQSECLPGEVDKPRRSSLNLAATVW